MILLYSINGFLLSIKEKCVYGSTSWVLNAIQGTSTFRLLRLKRLPIIIIIIITITIITHCLPKESHLKPKYIGNSKVKGKVIPLQARCGPGGG